jgi:hypothetical protein
MDPEYFWYDLNPDEMEAILNADKNRDERLMKRSWEQTREIAFHTFIAIQGNKKVKTPQDLISFPWEIDNYEALKKSE